MASISPYDVIRSPSPKPPRHSLLLRSLDLDAADGDPSLIPPPPVHYPNAGDHSSTTPDVPEDPATIVDINKPTAHERWEGGFSFYPESCGDGILWVPCGTHNSSAVTDAEAIQSYVPTAIQVDVTRSSFGHQAIDFNYRVTAFLNAVMHRVSGAEFWYGTKAQAEGLPNNYLTKAGYTDLGVAANPITALASIQDYLMTTGVGGWGFIHAPTRVVDQWKSDYVIEWVFDDVYNIAWRDAYGNEIISDPGYPSTVNGSGNWDIYATGPVYSKLGPTMIIPEDIKYALNRATNTIEYRAERMHAMVWDGCQHAKIQVAIS